MGEELTLRIKQQPFDPHFVLQIGEEELSANVSKLDDNHVVARIKNRGNYKIDIREVGFFFVEKLAKPYEGGKIPSGVNDGVPTRILRAAAKSLGMHCGDVTTELRYVWGVLSPRRPSSGER